MKAYLANWNILRLVRVAIGLFALVQAYYLRDSILAIIAAVVLFMAFANVGCCGANGCALTPKKKNDTEEITYEELDNK